MSDRKQYAEASKIGDIINTKRTLDETWLPCDGSYVSVTDYPDLADVLSDRVYGIDNKWIDHSQPFEGFQKLRYGDGIWVGVSYYGTFYWTTDIVAGNWTLCGTDCHNATYNTITNLYWSGSYWIKFSGSAAYYATTSNLKSNSWSSISGVTSPYSFGAGGGKYVIGKLTSIMYSTYPYSGYTEVTISNLFGQPYIFRVKYVNGYWFAFVYYANNSNGNTADYASIYYTDDITATTWSSLGQGNDVQYIDNKWYVIGYVGSYCFAFKSALTDTTWSYSGTLGTRIYSMFARDGKYYFLSKNYVHMFTSLAAGAKAVSSKQYSAYGAVSTIYNPVSETDGTNIAIASDYDTNSALSTSDSYNRNVYAIPSENKIKLPNNNGYIKAVTV